MSTVPAQSSAASPPKRPIGELQAAQTDIFSETFKSGIDGQLGGYRADYSEPTGLYWLTEGDLESHFATQKLWEEPVEWFMETDSELTPPTGVSVERNGAHYAQEVEKVRTAINSVGDVDTEQDDISVFLCAAKGASIVTGPAGTVIIDVHTRLNGHTAVVSPNRYPLFTLTTDAGTTYNVAELNSQYRDGLETALNAVERDDDAPTPVQYAGIKGCYETREAAHVYETKESNSTELYIPESVCKELATIATNTATLPLSSGCEFDTPHSGTVEYEWDADGWEKELPDSEVFCGFSQDTELVEGKHEERLRPYIDGYYLTTHTDTPYRGQVTVTRSSDRIKEFSPAGSWW